MQYDRLSQQQLSFLFVFWFVQRGHAITKQPAESVGLQRWLWMEKQLVALICRVKRTVILFARSVTVSLLGARTCQSIILTCHVTAIMLY